MITPTGMEALVRPWLPDSGLNTEKNEHRSEVEFGGHSKHQGDSEESCADEYADGEACRVNGRRYLTMATFSMTNQ